MQCSHTAEVTAIHLPAAGLGPGPWPTQLTTLTALQRINLAGNAFTGALPLVYTSLVELTGLDLRDNSISGP